MEDDEIEDYDREVELALYREYRDVVSQFKYVIETERRFYLANDVELVRRDTEHDFYFELVMNDVWVWDVYRSDRFVKSVRVLTFKDVNVEELSTKDFELPKELALDSSDVPLSSTSAPSRAGLCRTRRPLSTSPPSWKAPTSSIVTKPVSQAVIRRAAASACASPHEPGRHAQERGAGPGAELRRRRSREHESEALGSRHGERPEGPGHSGEVVGVAQL